MDQGHTPHQDHIVHHLDHHKPTDTVYGYVPAAVIRLCIEAHGGMVDGQLPEFTKPAWDGEE